MHHCACLDLIQNSKLVYKARRKRENEPLHSEDGAKPKSMNAKFPGGSVVTGRRFVISAPLRGRLRASLEVDNLFFSADSVAHGLHEIVPVSSLLMTARTITSETSSVCSISRGIVEFESDPGDGINLTGEFSLLTNWNEGKTSYFSFLCMHRKTIFT